MCGCGLVLYIRKVRLLSWLVVGFLSAQKDIFRGFLLRPTSLRGNVIHLHRGPLSTCRIPRDWKSVRWMRQI